MHQASLGRSRRFDSRAGIEVSAGCQISVQSSLYLQNPGHQPDTHSVLSGGSKMSKLCTKEPVERRITFRVWSILCRSIDRTLLVQDVQLIMPTVIILVFTIVIMITVIPYAFSSVLKQMEAVRALEAACELWPSLHHNIVTCDHYHAAELRRSISAGAEAVVEESNVTQTGELWADPGQTITVRANRWCKESIHFLINKFWDYTKHWC